MKINVREWAKMSIEQRLELINNAINKKRGFKR